ncbi:hypothetical protein [Butyrivibrio proteoclasticus]|uniref:hypothetical protein n=1 Tax=Butyrivibrio proteoclasticus TaxID=43305 RepID=UPI00068478F9|nr:hypothetical protein [Butyrivibrio proteoclasticus]
MFISDIALKEKQRLVVQLRALEEQFNKREFLEGKISFSKNGTSYKFFNLTNMNRSYIPAAEKDLIKSLCTKRYYEDKISAYKKEIRALDLFLSRSPKDPDDIIRKHPELRSFLLDVPEYADEIDEWATDDDECTKHPEHLIIQTLKGDMVRSKSEAMIADELFRSKVPYIYEKKLAVGSDFFYPDFTVKNKRTGQIYIWEHFGKMDDPKYIENNCLYKLNRYLRAGYIPSINFIATYEDPKNPFYPIKVSQIIEQYLT